jgi:hypothetical protein
MARVEQEIVAQIGRAGLRLRFDKVALRLVNSVKAAARNMVPDGQAVIFTIAAPIRHPAKTSAALEALVRDGLPGHAFSGCIHGNQVRIRLLTGVQVKTPRVLGFVHNPQSDAGAILGLAESRLRARGSL